MMIIDAQIVGIIRVLSNTKNEALISQVMKLVNEAQNAEIVGYEADGKPITHSDLVQSVKEAQQDVIEGRTKTTEELTAHFKNLAQNG